VHAHRQIRAHSAADEGVVEVLIHDGRTVMSYLPCKLSRWGSRRSLVAMAANSTVSSVDGIFGSYNVLDWGRRFGNGDGGVQACPPGPTVGIGDLPG
jgi:hypothetical protein